MRTGMQGAWGYNLRFTSEPHPTVFIRLFYVWLGELNRLFQVQPEIMYQIARWVFGLAALLSVYLLARRCFENDDARWKWFAFGLAIFGAGLGWLQRIAGWVVGPYTPIDYWLIDAYVLLSLSLFPHFALVLACMCTAFLCYLDYLQSSAHRLIVVVVLCALVVQLVNPVAFVVVDVALLVATLLHWVKSRTEARSSWVALAVVAIAQIPLFAYNFYVLTGIPVWRQFTAQNQTLSPPPVYYLMGFGLFWPPAVIGSIQAVRRKDIILLSSLAWVGVAFALAYLPVGIQRRFLLGVTIPFSLLATRGLNDGLRFLSRRNAWIARRVSLFALLMAIVVSMGTITFGLAQAVHMLSRPPEFFYSAGLDPAFDWIDRNTGADDVILSAERTGQLLAQKTGRRVFFGHEMETLDFVGKESEIRSYYRGELQPSQLLQEPIRWVVYGPYEREIAPSFAPGSELKVVFKSSAITIYRNRNYTGR
jgi:hypothetical protein